MKLKNDKLFKSSFIPYFLHCKILAYNEKPVDSEAVRLPKA